MNAEKLLEMIEAYRCSGGSAEHRARKESLENEVRRLFAPAIATPNDPRLDDIQETQRSATAEECEMADVQFGNNDIQIDEDALVAEIEGSENIWVQAWLYVRK